MDRCLNCRKPTNYWAKNGQEVRPCNGEFITCDCPKETPSTIAGQIFQYEHLQDQLWAIATILEELSGRIRGVEQEDD